MGPIGRTVLQTVAKNYIKATKIDGEAPDQETVIFLTCVGNDVYNVFTTMDCRTTTKTCPQDLVDAFEARCVGQVNEIYERYLFNRLADDNDSVRRSPG